ncbi:hypothetical protein FAK_08900 [Desulfoferula mesophila]|uniref:Uncharacterized protein n=1 Tax=Desulfoferula mesophila TaxID=3058419 RepID=A0AAU9EKV8_9BACT|nr:hypothetical protein FAK_08900 [Desulfoferula mesophilus]
MRGEDWRTVGRVLGDMFSGARPPVVISTTAAGAIPYYSKLLTIDMLGLNDKWIARNGIIRSTRPGHTRYATIQYLIDSKVNLVIAHPIVKEISSPATTDPNAIMCKLDVSTLPNTSKIVEIPLNSNYRLDVLYILRHGAVDSAIKRLGLVTHDIDVVKK